MRTLPSQQILKNLEAKIFIDSRINETWKRDDSIVIGGGGGGSGSGSDTGTDSNGSGSGSSGSSGGNTVRPTHILLSTNQNRTSWNLISTSRLTEFQNRPEPEVPEQNSTTTQPDFLSSWILIPSVLVPSILLPALIVPLSNNGRFRVREKSIHSLVTQVDPFIYDPN